MSMGDCVRLNLFGRVIATRAPVYGLASPSTKRGWLAMVGDGSVRFGYELISGVEMYVGACTRSESADGRSASIASVRLSLARDMCWETRKYEKTGRPETESVGNHAEEVWRDHGYAPE